VYDGARHHSIASEPGMGDRTVIADSCSKTWSMTGWRVGWAIAPGTIGDSINVVHQHLSVCATSFAQAGAVAAIEHGEDHTRRMVAEYADRRATLLERAARIPALRLDPPSGAFYAFPAVEGAGVALRLLEEAGVAVVPGEVFGEAFGGHLRISYSVSAPELEEGPRPHRERALVSRVLLTGGAGFIGSHLARALLDDGWAVDVVDDLSTGNRANVPDGAKLQKLDLARPGATEELADGPYDAVAHLAGQSSGEKSFDDPGRDIDSNTRSTVVLADWALARGVPRFVHASSMGVYGQVGHAAGEESTAARPISWYGASKLAAERALAVASSRGLSTCSLRMFSIYGPGQDLREMRQGMVVDLPELPAARRADRGEGAARPRSRLPVRR